MISKLQSKEGRSRGSVDWPLKIQTTNLVGPFFLSACNRTLFMDIDSINGQSTVLLLCSSLLFSNWLLTYLSNWINSQAALSVNFVPHLWITLATSKGQMISEAIFLVLNSSKKQTKCLQNCALSTRDEVFCSFFWKNLKQEKNLLMITDL